jgi:DNA (cytosine-5)-methyltransferase 1
LLRVFARRIEELLPKVVILENVSGLTHKRNRSYLAEFVADLSKLGYSCHYDVLDAADYGVPQHRRRLILIGSRDVFPALPIQTNSNPRANGCLLPWKTVRDAIGELPALEPGQRCQTIPLHEATTHSGTVLKLIRRIPHDGGGRKDLPRKLWLPCHKRLDKEKGRGAESIYGRMRWDEPSPTITTRSNVPSCGRFIHPDQDRGITLREAARLQSIPDDFVIEGYKEKVGCWIGNAMPCDLAEALGRQAIHCV